MDVGAAKWNNIRADRANGAKQNKKDRSAEKQAGTKQHRQKNKMEQSEKDRVETKQVKAKLRK